MHLIVFSHLRWNFVYQRPQHLLSRLALHWRVIFVEEPVADSKGAWLDVSTPMPNVTVLRPHTTATGTGFSDEQLPVIADQLGRYLDGHHIINYVAWFYTPLALPLLDELSPRAVVYDCMDELSAFKNPPPRLGEREAGLLHVADLVLTGGPGLYAAKRDRNPNVVCLPSAVDAAHYSPRQAKPDPLALRHAEQLQGATNRPRLGFFGVIDERLDLDLIAAVADASPHWSVVMVGPVVKIDPATLPRRANIAWLGQQSYETLPYLVQGWDVCLLPFALNESTRFISPTKTLEYLAAEKPVVSTAIHDVVTLYGDAVRVAQDRAQFVEHCTDVLGETGEQRDQRLAMAKAKVDRYSWDRAAAQVHIAILDVLNLPGHPAVMLRRGVAANESRTGMASGAGQRQSAYDR